MFGLSDTVSVALVTAIAGIIVALIPQLFRRLPQGLIPNNYYKILSVMAFLCSIVAMTVVFWPRNPSIAKIFEASTEPRYGYFKVEKENHEYGLNDYDYMIRYLVSFSEPVDYIIPTFLNHAIWYVQKLPQNLDGRVWVVSFQIPNSERNPEGKAMGYGSFIGVRLNR